MIGGIELELNDIAYFGEGNVRFEGVAALEM